MHSHLTYFSFVWLLWGGVAAERQSTSFCCYRCCQLHLQNAFAVEYTSAAQRMLCSAEDVKTSKSRSCSAHAFLHKWQPPQRRHLARYARYGTARYSVVIDIYEKGYACSCLAVGLSICQVVILCNMTI